MQYYTPKTHPFPFVVDTKLLVIYRDHPYKFKGNRKLKNMLQMYLRDNILYHYKWVALFTGIDYWTA